MVRGRGGILMVRGRGETDGWRGRGGRLMAEGEDEGDGWLGEGKGD